MLDNPIKTAALAQVLTDAREQPKVSKSVADWFQDNVVKSRSGLFSMTTTLTPEMARLLLGGNESNRTISNAHVQRLVSDIKDGAWALNGESIKISGDGRLADGQHRCHAVILADKPIATVVTFGVDYDLRTTTDQGKTKTVGDYLSMESNTKSASTVAATARLLLAHRLGVRYLGAVKSIITKTRIRQEYYDNQKSIDAAVAFSVSNVSARAFGGQSFIAAAMVILSRKSPNAEDFILQFIKGNDLKSGDPILVARERFIREPRMVMYERITLIIKAFDAWLDGREVTRIQIKGRYAIGNKKAKR
jgi:hypothetical protein